MGEVDGHMLFRNEPKKQRQEVSCERIVEIMQRVLDAGLREDFEQAVSRLVHTILVITSPVTYW
jgi:hypothetical protein